MNPIKLIISCF